MFESVRRQIEELKIKLIQIEAVSQKKKGTDQKIRIQVEGMLQPLLCYVNMRAKDFISKYAHIKDGMADIETEEEVTQRMAEEFEKRRP